ncbi:MAG: EFR1 family ferrodoxin [Bacteroidales bacterium]|nr:EFR1 family ferrodoxin [Bacteroidales bacterium]
MTRLIFYFTGTGNSLYVARSLSLSGQLPVSIPQALHRDPSDYVADEIGFVFPSYGQLAPAIVQDFLSVNHFRAQYFFTVITYGYRNSNAADLWHRRAASLGVNFDYVTSLLMVDNYLPEFDMTRQASYDKNVDGQIARVRTEIDARVHRIDPFSVEDVRWHEALAVHLEAVGNDRPFATRAEQLVIVGEGCIGCGVCTHVCPHGNWRLEPVASGLRARCEGPCETCLACVQNCPQKALTLHQDRNPQARYRHPAVSLSDLIVANDVR